MHWSLENTSFVCRRLRLQGLLSCHVGGTVSCSKAAPHCSVPWVSSGEQDRQLVAAHGSLSTVCMAVAVCCGQRLFACDHYTKNACKDSVSATVTVVCARTCSKNMGVLLQMVVV